MSNNVCQRCKHWRRGGELNYENWRAVSNPDYQAEKVGELKGCPVVALGNESSKDGLCLHPLIVSDYVTAWLGIGASACPVNGVYASGYDNRGHLTTGESFGCIHFEPILTPNPQGNPP